MKTKVFSLFDTKAEAFGVPFFMPQRGMALRAVADLANDPATLVSKHRVDFILYELGEFEDSTGMISPYHVPKNLGVAPSAVPAVDSVLANREQPETLDLSFIKTEKN